MSNVYVVNVGYEMEGEGTLAVFSSKELAVEYIDTQDLNTPDYYTVLEVDVDNPQLNGASNDVYTYRCRGFGIGGE